MMEEKLKTYALILGIGALALTLMGAVLRMELLTNVSLAIAIVAILCNAIIFFMIVRKAKKR